MLAWPAVWLAELPAAWSLLCEHASGRRWVVTTSQHNYTRRRSHGLAVMHGDEWLALCVAAAQGRATLAVGQWLVPTMPPPPPRVAPDWTVPPQALARLLGPAEAQLGQPGQLGQRVADVLAHFRARAIALDPPTEATCDELL